MLFLSFFSLNYSYNSRSPCICVLLYVNLPRFEGDNFKRRRRRSTDDQVKLHFNAYDEDFHFTLQHKRSVIHPEAKIVITNYDKEDIWTGQHPDCFLTGEVTSHEDGTVSMSYCDEVVSENILKISNIYYTSILEIYHNH